MAVEVLSGAVEHTALHDAESMFYVLIWLAFTQAGPNGLKRNAKGFTIKGTILDDWCPEGEIDQAKLNNIANTKRGVVANPDAFLREVLGKMHPYFAALRSCLYQMSIAFFPLPSNPDRYLMEIEAMNEVDSDGVDATVGITAPKEDTRPKEEVIKILNEVLKRSIKEATRVELAKSNGQTQTSADIPREIHVEKYVSDLIPPMQLRDRMVVADPVIPPPIQEAPSGLEEGQQLRRSDRIKSLQARRALSVSGSRMVTGKRPRTEEGSRHLNNKKSRESGQVNK